MASKKTSTTTPASPRSSEVKMVTRHAAFQEADVAATQEASGPIPGEGPNPHPKGTARWSAHENFKRMAKGLPATNSIND